MLLRLLLLEFGAWAEAGALSHLTTSTPTHPPTQPWAAGKEEGGGGGGQQGAASERQLVALESKVDALAGLLAEIKVLLAPGQQSGAQADEWDDALAAAAK